MVVARAELFRITRASPVEAVSPPNCFFFFILNFVLIAHNLNSYSCVVPKLGLGLGLNFTGYQGSDVTRRYCSTYEYFASLS